MNDATHQTVSSGDVPAPKKSFARAVYAVAHRWAKGFILLPLLVGIAIEVAGSRWPLVLLTPFTPQGAIMASVGVLLLAGIVIVGKRFEFSDAQKPGRKRPRRFGDRTWLIGGTLLCVYAWAIVLGLVPWRVVPSLAKVNETDAKLGTIKVLSCNVLTRNTDHAAVLDLIEKEDADVLVMMELNSRWTGVLREALKTKYPTSRFVPDDSGNFGLGLWTRLPVDSATLDVMATPEGDGRFDVPQLFVTLRLTDPTDSTKSHAVRLYGMHPLPPTKPGMAHARDSVISRTATLIADHPETPSIVAGDLNSTIYCRIPRTLSTRAGLFDAAAGLRYTWPIGPGLRRKLMAIRIDHVLASDHFRVVESHVGRSTGSDHKPVIATLQLVKSE